MLAPDPRPWLPPLWQLAAVAIVSGLTAWIGIALTHQVGNIAAVWFTNGILVAVLLTRPVRQWPALLAIGLLGIGVAGLAVGQSLPGLPVLQVSDAIDILLPASLLRYRRGISPDLALPGAFVEFTLIAVLLTPALSGLLAALLLAPMWHLPFLPLLRRWYLGDALGIAVMTPLALAVLRGELRPLLAPAALARTLGVIGIYLLVITLAFSEGRFPLLFLPIPLLLLVVARLGFPSVGLIILPTAAIGFGVTASGHGPLMLIPDISPAQRMEFLQIYIAIASATAYSIGVIIAGRRRLNQALLDQNARLADSERLYRLLADNASDIITRVPLDGQHMYYSPAVTEVLGWSVAEVEQFGLRRHVHPEDDSLFRSVHEQMSAGLSETSVTFRCARKAGGWAWVEARVHLVRDRHGAPKEFIAILRDVTRQKETELALEAAMVKLSQQAITDGLTGIANRRRFDEVLPREWRRAMRGGDPLSLLLIDVDHFKAFNDRLGHQGGDECLRLIAQTIAGVIRRPHDLVARYGGEEFVAVLPATSLEGAQRIAEALRAAVAAMPVPQPMMPQLAGTNAAVTVSIGVATAIPTGDTQPASLIDAADAALYTAKRNGRNRVSVADRSDRAREPTMRVSPLLAAPLDTVGA